MEYLLLAVLGLAVGALGTLIGAGGGFVLMPILMLVYPHQSARDLTAISLAMVFFNAGSGSFSYARMKRIDYRSGLLFLSMGLPASLAGAVLIRYVPRAEYDIAFGVLLIAASAFIFFRPPNESGPKARLGHRFRRVVTDAAGTRHEYVYNLPLGMGLSLLVGAASSMLGIGGGIIHVPAMVHLLDFPVHVATATSHFILTAMALSATIVHLGDGSLRGSWPMVVSLSAGAVAGAQLGARLSGRIRGRWIMRALAAALAIVGARILITALWR
jgi:hypothetical protein